MKKIFIILIGFILTHYLQAQDIAEKEIKTTVGEVTVFLEGAQITRSKDISIPAGKTLLKFTDLSPFIDAKSIQVKAEGKLTVLNVNHQQNFLAKPEKPEQLKKLESRLDEINESINMESTMITILQEEMKFLQDNRDLGGRDQELNVANLKATLEYYSSRFKAVKLEEIERNKKIREMNKEKQEIQNQINTITSKREYPAGEILVKVDAQSALTASIDLSYMVSNASWFPSYDIRAKNINEPVELIYKANVKQDTKEDWNDVKLRLSSSDPNVSGVAPELRPWFLSYNSLPPVYRSTPGFVSGRILDERGNPLIGASIFIEGTTIGTVADFNGNYSLTLPPGTTNLVANYIGYETQVIPVSGSYMNISLNESAVTLDEVVVTGYGAQSKFKAARLEDDAASEIRIRGTSTLALPAVQVEKQTTVNFEIEIPYTIRSDNKNYSVDMADYSLPAYYQYFCVPKIDKDAFLIAGIIDWEKYNLLEGEANVFFEDTYVGKTILDVRYAEDTLNISLGRDKNVSVKREKVKDFTTKQFIGNKKEETRSWMITVKNNKSSEINMLILDQVPVSTQEEIEVEVQKLSGGIHTTETGEIKWEFTLRPTGQKELELRYAVKYPKSRNLIIE